jgi:hypothetical protein
MITEGQNTPAVKVQPGSAGGDIEVTATNSGGTGNARKLAVVVNPPVTGNTVSPDQVINDSVTPATLVGSTPAGGDGVYAYYWESSTTGSESDFRPAAGLNQELNYIPGLLVQTTWFRRKVTSRCETLVSNVVKITVEPAPTITITPLSTTEICAGATLAVPFTTTGVIASQTLFSVELVNPDAGNAQQVIGTSTTSPVTIIIPPDLKRAGAYQLRINTSIPATVKTGPNVNIYILNSLAQSQPIFIAGNTTPCAGTASVQYSIEAMPGASSYEWTVPDNWIITGGKNSRYLTVTAGSTAGVISVAGINSCGRSQAGRMAVNPVIVAAPVVAGASRCENGSVTLTATGAPDNGEYRWYPAATGGAAISTAAIYTTPTLVTTTSYYVSVVANGCESARTEVTATINALPVVQVGAVDSVCVSAGSLILNDYSPGGGTWTGAGVMANGVFNPAKAGVGTHTLRYTVTAQGCTASSTKTVVITPMPTVTLAPFNPVCLSATRFILTGGQPGGGAYTGAGVTNGVFNATTAGAGTHEITYTYLNAGGCAVTTRQNITVSGTCLSDLEANLAASPNPTSSLLQVSLPLPVKTDITLRLLDTKGLIVYERHYSQVSDQFKQTLDIEYNAKGIYTLYLILDNARISKRVMIQ